MLGSITLQIPIKNFLKKYLQKKFGEKHLVSRDSWLGIYISDILNKEYNKQKVSVTNESYYCLVVPSSIALNNGFSIDRMKYKRLENMIKKVFYNDLYSYISISIDNDLKIADSQHNSIIKQNRMRAIKQFLLFYEIDEDDLKLDSVYRQIQRLN